TPDRFVGVSLRKQVEYRALSERIAYGNKRVEAFSQYLLRDDDPIEGKSARERYGGFESGLKFATGVDKPSLEAFRLTLSPLRTSRGVRLWGVVRPAGGRTRAEILVRDRGEEEFRV